MPLNYTAAPSSRITKPSARNPLARRSIALSPFSAHTRRKPIRRPKTHTSPQADDDSDSSLPTSRLPDTGLPAPLPISLPRPTITSALPYIQDTMFTPLPERAAGMSSTRIAEVLNFRRALPPIVTFAHVHALLGAPTATEREVAKLMREGIVRKIVILGREAGAGEGLVLVKEWEKVVRENRELREEIKQTLFHHLRTNPTAITLPQSLFAPADATSLLHAGFLTSSTQSWTTTDVYSQPSRPLLGTLTSLSRTATTAASGTLAAVGGQNAIHNSGGNVGANLTNPTSDEFHLTLPTTGAYLRLLTSARSHLLSLLAKSPYREAPLSLLRERWDGGVADPMRNNQRKPTDVLPGRTKKWRVFYGLEFDWVLAECVGAGLVELFETGSVGLGVRGTGKRG